MIIKPKIFNTNHLADQRKRDQLINSKSPNIVDSYKEQVLELFKIQNPLQKNNEKQAELFAKKYISKNRGNWVYFPWINTLNHILVEEDFYKVRTARNKPLISDTLQQKFRKMTIGIVGLSVGNSVALSIAYSGGADKIKLADPDTLELSNLNRVRASLNNLGENKTIITAKQIYEINPYAQISFYEKGINYANIKDFFISDPKLDLIIDECDDLVLKKYLRLVAKNLQIPLLMASDNGFESNIDLQKPTKTSESLESIIESYRNTKKTEMNEKDQIKFIAGLVGAQNFSPGMQQATYEKLEGKIASWPQLAMTVFLGGALASYTALIHANKTQKSIHKIFSFPDLLDPKWNSKPNRTKRNKNTTKFVEFISNL